MLHRSSVASNRTGRVRFRARTLMLALTTVVSATCGSTGPGTTAQETPAPVGGTIVIASDLPTQGADATAGLPSQNGVQYAITSKGALKGYQLTFLPFDDSVNGVHDTKKGAENVHRMIDNPAILGMVGPLNSNVAVAEIPVGAEAGLAMISASNTNECLTQSFPYCSPPPANLRAGHPNNYFRIAAADTIQGPAMADFAIDTLKIKKVAVWSDSETYGKGVADQFTKELQRKGGNVVARQDFDKAATDFHAFLQTAKDNSAQAIFAGATSATHGCLPRAQSKGVLDDSYYLGPDGLSTDQCIRDAADMANDRVYTTLPAADATQSTDSHAKAVVADFKKQFTKKEDTGLSTFQAYDCASILIDAIGRAIDLNHGRLPSRAQVVAAMAKTKEFKGITGTYTFDQNGDPTQPTMAFFQLKGATPAWTFYTQFAVSRP